MKSRMKYFITGLVIILSSMEAMANQATPHSIRVKRAVQVLKTFVLPTQINSLTPEALNKTMVSVTYQDLRPRDILRITADTKIGYRNPRNFLDREEGFISESGQYSLNKGEFVRVIQQYSGKSLQSKAKADFTGVQNEFVETIEFTVIKLDANFKPTGESFYLSGQSNVGGKVPNVERFEGGFMSRNPSLRLSRAGLGDLVMNAQDVKANKGFVIPAFTPAIITKIISTRIAWTISNYDYVATIYLLNCPKELYAQKCEVEIYGTKAYPDPLWAHYTMPENRREKKIWGMTLMY